jgi:hypothetical protein
MFQTLPQALPQALLFQLLLLLLLLPLLQPLPPSNPREVPLVAIQRPCLKALLVLLPVPALHPITFMPFNWTSSLQWMTRLNYDLVNLSESSMSTMTAG